MNTVFDKDVKYLPGVGEKRALLLKTELNIKTVGDLLNYYPYRYLDKSQIYRIRDIDPNTSTHIQIRARVESIQALGERNKKRLRVIVSDGSGRAELVWFKGINWIQKQLEAGREYMIFGKPSFFSGSLNLVHPEIESTLGAKEKFFPGVIGIYSITEKLTANHITSKTIFNTICTAWQAVGDEIPETLPRYVIEQYGMMSLTEALFNIHFPSNNANLNSARFRLKFEELLGIQLNILSTKKKNEITYKGFIFKTVGDLFNRFYEKNLPFPLTGAQKRVLKEIRHDFLSGKQMNRLLQGDVGSGKTLVALMSMLIAVENGYQACLMAPTEILANQHLEYFTNLLSGLGVDVELLTGSTTKAERNRILNLLREGEIKILIGTHALIEDRVVFSNLGYVIIDEQHRFGVEQRARLWMKNTEVPHILVMTATPIPRTLAMTLYGDLDVSVIDELPPGRKPVRTLHFYDSHRLRMLGFIENEIKKGRQVYIVYPLIKGSEKMDYLNLEEGYEGITRVFPPPEYTTLVVHGKMKQAEKDYGMKMFKEGKANILLATSVIEVGVNVPNATVMVIESAERFGLSQLHQLRGRVGRGADQSYCILMTSVKLSKESRKRMEAMVETTDGFELAELDMQLRGAGDLHGTQQSGMAFELKIANLGKDGQILALARETAILILDKDPLLTNEDNRKLRILAGKFTTDKLYDFSMIS
ncbi:MAG: ATP-dependent DNA helicase RecG [Rikenellaceae bacterium]|nr:ATP-dependent DNA helicase RecG [Rikenellaceae bacterium]